MSANEGYDGTVSLSRKLTEDESRELRITLLPYFTTETGVGVDDITDYLDYTFTMVSNSKEVTYVVKELEGLCSPEVSTKVGRELAAFIKKLNGDKGTNGNNDSRVDEQGKRVISLKSSEEKGNALTMAGALGASRLGGRNKTEKVEKGRPEKGEEKEDKRNKRGDRSRNDRRDNGRRDSDRKGGRGSRSVQVEAFERLSKGGDRGLEDGPDRRRDDRGGRGCGRGDRDDGFDRRREDRGGRGGRGHGGRGPRDMSGRGGSDEGRFGRGGRGDQMSGNRRSRDDLDDELDFIPPDERGGRGRGLGRGRGGRDGPKRPRYEGGYGDGFGHDDYGGGHGHGGYDYYDYGYGYQSSPPLRGGGRGRNVGRGRGRVERSFEDRSGVSNEAGTEAGSETQEIRGSGAGGENIDHPSPMVQASFGGRGGYGLRGRGFVRGGRGRGHFGGRAQVVSMIASKTWVRKKDFNNEHGGDKGGGEGGEGVS